MALPLARSGRKRQGTEGRVPVPMPVSISLLNDHSAAARAASSSTVPAGMVAPVFQPVFAGQHDDAGGGHRRRFLRRVVQQVAERGGAGEALAEQRDAAQRLDAGGRGFGLHAHLAGQRAGDDADQQEHHQSHQVPRVADRERVDRRQEEEIPQQESGDGGGQADARPNRLAMPAMTPVKISPIASCGMTLLPRPKPRMVMPARMPPEMA